MLLVIISIIILLVGNNVARAFSLAGAFSLILCGVMIVLFLTNFAMSKTKNMQLKIIVPEDLNYEGVFEEVLDVYTTTFHIERVKTRDFGALLELGDSININGSGVKSDKNKSNSAPIYVKNADKKIVKYTPTKQYSSIIVSSSKFKDGESYDLYIGNSKVQNFTISGSVTNVGSSNGGNIGMPGGGKGNRR